MNAAPTVPSVQTPSKVAIAKATLIALVVALLILFVAVLPAEYGIDPLHTGKLLGLTGLSQASESGNGTVGRATPAQTGIYVAEPASYKVDSEDMSLLPGEGVEVKYHMQKGAAMVYAWKADAKVQFEFHGEPDVKPKPDYYESYLLDNKLGQDQSNGSFTAPSTGIHGWFWENKTKKMVTIHLTTAGYYDWAKMYSGDEKIDLEISDPK